MDEALEEEIFADHPTKKRKVILHEESQELLPPQNENVAQSQIETQTQQTDSMELSSSNMDAESTQKNASQEL